MADNSPQVPREAMQLGHEPGESGGGHAARFVGWFAVGIAVSIALAVLSAFGIVGGFLIPAAPVNALPGAESAPAEAKPALQRAPSGDLRAYLGDKEQALHGYGWVDRGAGIVHIPIERAMQLTAEANGEGGNGAQGAGGEGRP